MTQPATAELDVERSLSPPNEQLSCHWEIGNVAVNSEGCQPRATAVLDTFMFVSLVCFCSVCFSYQSYLIFRKKTKEICNETQCDSMRASLKLSHPQYALIIVALSSMHHALVLQFDSSFYKMSWQRTRTGLKFFARCACLISTERTVRVSLRRQWLRQSPNHNLTK